MYFQNVNIFLTQEMLSLHRQQYVWRGLRENRKQNKKRLIERASNVGENFFLFMEFTILYISQ